MNCDYLRESLGPAHLTLGGLDIWISEEVEAEDSNIFLNITASCSADGSQVWISGPIILYSDIANWYTCTEPLYRELRGSAELNSVAGLLKIGLQMHFTGSLTTTVLISPDWSQQQHNFTFELDQTYLGLFRESCKQLLDRS